MNNVFWPVCAFSQFVPPMLYWSCGWECYMLARPCVFCYITVSVNILYRGYRYHRMFAEVLTLELMSKHVRPPCSINLTSSLARCTMWCGTDMMANFFPACLLLHNCMESLTTQLSSLILAMCFTATVLAIISCGYRYMYISMLASLVGSEPFNNGLRRGEICSIGEEKCKIWLEWPRCETFSLPDYTTETLSLHFISCIVCFLWCKQGNLTPLFICSVTTFTFALCLSVPLLCT